MSDNKNVFSKMLTHKLLFGIPIVVVIALIVGAAGLGVVQYTLHASSTNEFCIGCHVGMDTVVEEYQESVHFSNRVGIKAECQDCHIPQDAIPYLVTKVTAAKDIWYKLTRGITLENFESDHRERLANHVWDTMKTQGSSTCMSCHDFDQMILAEQSKSAQRQHDANKRGDKTCIDCHTGVAHKLPEEDLGDLFTE